MRVLLITKPWSDRLVVPPLALRAPVAEKLWAVTVPVVSMLPLTCRAGVSPAAFWIITCPVAVNGAPEPMTVALFRWMEVALASVGRAEPEEKAGVLAA